MTRTIALASLIIALFDLSFSYANESKTIKVGKRELQFENSWVKVWKTTLKPGQQLHMHRHETHRVVVPLMDGKLSINTDSGDSKLSLLEKGKAYWATPNPAGQLHNDLNDTDKDLEIMVIELINQ